MPTEPTVPQLRRYNLPGLHAIAPHAYGVEYAPPALPPVTKLFELVASDRGAVVDVCGPLAYASWELMTYDSVRTRVAAACASAAQVVILKVNSPGGDVAGAFDCARALRAMCRAAGKQLVTFTESQAASAAYALLAAGDQVWASSTALVGSIGVIAAEIDITRADAAMGVGYNVIMSGARKSDGNPHVALTDDARAAIQARVDGMAGVFFELVAELRGAGADAVAALQAGLFMGAGAIGARLIDRTGSWDALLAAVTEGATLQANATQVAPASTEPASMADDKDKKDDAPKEDAVRASLVTASTSDDPDKAARAKAALTAYDADEVEDKPAKDKDDDKAQAAAAGAVSAQATAAMAATLQAVSAELGELKAERQARARADAEAKALADRTAFYAGRPDLTAETRASLASLPLEQVKAIVATIPVGKARVLNPHAPPILAGAGGVTLGDTQTGAHTLASRPNAALDIKCGLVPMTRGVVAEGNVLHLGKAIPAAHAAKV